MRRVLPSEDLDVVITGLQETDAIEARATIRIGDEVASKFSLVLEKNSRNYRDPVDGT